MPPKKAYYLTQAGLEKLRAELEELSGPRRKELAKRLRTAIQQGDLSENADYIKAKEDQGFLEGRIQEIEAMLGNYVLISEGSGRDGVIAIGSKITIQRGSGDPVKYFLVGAQEADPRNGRISNESPIGMALLGHSAGERVEVDTPAGKMTMEILDVE